MGLGNNSDQIGIPQFEDKDILIKKALAVDGHVSLARDRYVLEEYFSQLPQLNNTIDQVHTTELARQANNHFELLGTNASDADVTFSTTVAGIQLQTDGGSADQIIILPHLDAGATAWTGVLWGTENQVVWETMIRTDASVADVTIWAGLKLTNVDTIVDDANQVYFRFDSTDDTNWNAIDSIADTDVATDTGVAVAASTNYHLAIAIDADRKAHFFINGDEVRVSAALTNDISFIPYIGVQDDTGAAKTIHLSYIKMSRIIFE